MNLSDFDFDLPEHLIATRPARPRSASRLLVAEGGRIEDRVFGELSGVLRPGDRLVLNDTRVIPARLLGRRRREGAGGPSEARIEVTLLAPDADECCWSAMVKPLRKIRDGEWLDFGDGLGAELIRRDRGEVRLKFNKRGPAFDGSLERAGHMPLPPYISARRAPDAQDRVDYQSVWARANGAVAAPTASLHFDNAILKALAERGVDQTFVTLHVGAGTFVPVKVDDICSHKMHGERGQVSARAAADIRATRAAGGRIIAVGTTAMRALETAAGASGEMREWSGETDIFITPGHRFLICDGLITNFHLPRSTLLMLVSAFLGMDEIWQLYAHAIAAEYRFFSYGDASLLIPDKKP